MDRTRLHRCLEPGLAILVGTADPAGVPLCTRGIALRSADDLETVTVYLPVATSHETIHNLATTRQVAIVATNPRANVSTQLKGTTIEARLAREDESAFVEGRHDTFADVLHPLGTPRRLTRSVAHWPAFAVTIRVEHVFDQTPGPNAGNRLT